MESFLTIIIDHGQSFNIHIIRFNFEAWYAQIGMLNK